MDEAFDPALLAALLGLFAHDLRNPLSALRSNVAFVQGVVAPGDPDVSEALFDAHAACDGLVDVVDNLEILALALRGPLAVDLAPLPVAAVVSEVVMRLGPTAKSHETSIELSGVDERRDVSVLSQREMLARSLSNLVRNAIQHGGRGPVRVTLAVDRRSCTLRVEDAGPALADELGDDAFTAAGQLRAKTALGGRYGRGLGLFCARVAADAIRATLISAPRSGAMAFELRVPLAPGA